MPWYFKGSHDVDKHVGGFSISSIVMFYQADTQQINARRLTIMS